LLPDRGEKLFGELAAHRDDREPYGFDYDVVALTGERRTLLINVTNEFDDDGGRIALFAVAKDITEQAERERALRAAREHASTLAEKSQALAHTDPLSGLANRRATFAELDRLIRAAGEGEKDLSVVMFDVDHFKRINDCFGHHTGDQVLTKIADVARSVMRGQDLVGRIGGEEFVCLLPGVGAYQARVLAERLRRAVADKGVDDGPPLATISLGFAVYQSGDDRTGLLARADAALYEAKEAGRNQVRRAA
jgi:diguanylate cyclase (GGDEF)-like protein